MSPFVARALLVASKSNLQQFLYKTRQKLDNTKSLHIGPDVIPQYLSIYLLIYFKNYTIKET